MKLKLLNLKIMKIIIISQYNKYLSRFIRNKKVSIKKIKKITFKYNNKIIYFHITQNN